MIQFSNYKEYFGYIFLYFCFPLSKTRDEEEALLCFFPHVLDVESYIKPQLIKPGLYRLQKLIQKLTFKSNV